MMVGVSLGGGTPVSLKENIVMRLIGLFIFIAPNRGAAFLTDVHVRTQAEVNKRKRVGAVQP